MREFLGGKVQLHAGDCREVVASLADASVDSCVCDPPYALVSIGKRFGTADAKPAKAGVYARGAAGFMGKKWDNGEVAFAAEFWAQVYRVLKPGGHVLAFGGTRTYHRLACAVEDAGFEIRDQIGYAFGSGFPKSHNISRNLDHARCRCETPQRDVRSMRDSDVPEAGAAQGAGREVLLSGVPQPGTSTARRQKLPASEIRGSKSGMEGRSDLSKAAWELRLGEVRPLPAASDLDGAEGRIRDGASAGDGGVGRPPPDASGDGASPGPFAAQQSEIELGALADEPGSQAGGIWPVCGGCGKPIIPDGLGTALKPAWEPIVVARKPIGKNTVAENVLEHGTGALNIDGCRVEADAALSGRAPVKRNSKPGRDDGYRMDRALASEYVCDKGRWPANIIHDGSDEVVAAFPDSNGQRGDLNATGRDRPTKTAFGNMAPPLPHAARGDSGSAARFFYTSKADADDRLGSKHPTVKPLDLMRYLVRLVTPPGGTVLDPFAGTGTTGEAAWREGMRAVLIEREPEYQADIARRMELAENPTKRAAVAVSKNKLQGAEGTPLFGGVA